MAAPSSAGATTAARAEFRATHRFARISARKARLVVDLVRGDAVERALTKLQFCKKRAAPMVRKVVLSAIANATQKEGLEAEQLYVDQVFVDEGPTMKRWRPRSMGRAFPRLKRTCHIGVILKQVEKVDGGKKRRSTPAGEPAAAPAPEETNEGNE